MSNIIFRHRKFPCLFVWNDPEENWEKIRSFLIQEIEKEGFDNFVKVEEKNEDR